MKNEWHISFKIVDRNLRRQHKKSVITSINVNVPTEMVEKVFSLIYCEIDKFRSMDPLNIKHKEEEERIYNEAMSRVEVVKTHSPQCVCNSCEYVRLQIRFLTKKNEKMAEKRKKRC